VRLINFSLLLRRAFQQREKPGATLGGGEDSLDRESVHTCELREWVSVEPSFFGTFIRAIFLEQLRSI